MSALSDELVRDVDQDVTTEEQDAGENRPRPEEDDLESANRRRVDHTDFCLAGGGAY